MTFRRNAPLLAVVLASLALHGLGLWLVSAEPPPPQARPPPIQMTWFESPPPEPVVPEEKKAPPPAPPTASTGTRAQRPETDQAANQAPSSGEATAKAAADAPTSQQRGSINLTPGVGAVFNMPVAPSSIDEHGSTVMNGPGEVIDQVIAKEVEGEKLTRKLNDDLIQDLGRAAVESGAIPGHFLAAQTTMRKALKTAKIDVSSQGAPLAEIFMNQGPSAATSQRMADSAMGRSIATNGMNLPGMDDQRSREAALQMMAGTEALVDRLRKARLKTVLELTTDASGAIADVSVVQKSGDTNFDESVLHLSRKVFRLLPDNDDKALGASWWRSRWQFTWEPPEVRVQLISAHRVPGN